MHVFLLRSSWVADLANRLAVSQIDFILCLKKKI